MTTRLGPPASFLPEGTLSYANLHFATWYIVVPPILLFLSVRKGKSKRIQKDLLLWEEHSQRKLFSGVAFSVSQKSPFVLLKKIKTGNSYM